MEVVVVVDNGEHVMEVPLWKMGPWMRDVDGMLKGSIETTGETMISMSPVRWYHWV